MFPDAWQEVVQHDQFGEKHVADVRTEHGLTLEFQRSYLKPEECTAREMCYGNMLWIVDGSRLGRDLPRFLDGFNSCKAIAKGVYISTAPEEIFPSNWIACKAPVLFDFANTTVVTERAVHLIRPLWCLLPKRVLGRAVVLPIPREHFVSLVHSTPHPIQSQATIDAVTSAIGKQSVTHRQRPAWLSRQRRRYARF